MNFMLGQCVNSIAEKYTLETGTCECCGDITMFIGGVFESNGNKICRFAFRWTKGKEDEPWALFIVADPDNAKIGISVEYRRNENGMMIVDKDRFMWPKFLLSGVTDFHSRDSILASGGEKWVCDVFDYLFVSIPELPKLA